MDTVNDDGAPSPSPATDSERASRHRTMLGLLSVLLLASWLLSMAGLPWSLLAGLTAIGSLVLLIPVVLQSFRQGRRVLALLMALVGVPATLLIIMSTSLSLVFYGPMSDLQECRAAALTERAMTSCNQQMEESMASWLSALLGG